MNSKITIIIPAKNSISTIEETLLSIKSFNQDLIEEILYFDDNSTDSSVMYVKKFLEENFKKFQVIENKIPQGLAKNYNQAINICKSRYLLIIHQDIKILDPAALEKTLKAFDEDSDCVWVQSIVTHPIDLYKKYNFWMKAHFSRIVEKKYPSSGGKFDCFDLQRFNLRFDEKIFKNSGEDADMQFQVKNLNKKILNSKIEIIHNHSFNPNYSFYDYILKELQMNETYGVLYRKHFLKYDFKSLILMFHRIILSLGIFIPYVNLIFLPLVIFYTFYYSKRVFETENHNPKIFLVPFVNLIILLLSPIWNFKGFILKKQTL